MTRRRRFAGVLLITGVLLEIALRLVLGGDEHGQLYLWRSTGLADGRCVGLRPGAQVDFTGLLLRIPTVRLQVNALGYRGPERPRAKPPHTFRLAAVGDSYTYGFSVREGQSLPAYLQRDLARASPAIEVLNFGLPGAQLEDEIPQTRDFALQWHPDLVVLFLFWNDLDPSLCSWHSGFRRWLAGVAKRVYVARIPVIVALVAGTPANTLEHRVAFRTRFEELKGATDLAGARLAVVVLGDPLDKPGGDRVADSASPVLRSTMRELGLPWLDARAWLSRQADQHPLPTIPWDAHFAPEGNRVAAARVAAWLVAQRLVPAPHH